MWIYHNLTHIAEIPSIHPVFAIHSPDGSNHTPAFADAARTPEAHKACMAVTKALAITSLRLLQDDDFLDLVSASHPPN